jgi:hypothetical protein
LWPSYLLLSLFLLFPHHSEERHCSSGCL